jgi:alpha-galactosidase
MDAGWYGIDTKPTPDEFGGDWGSHTGDWRVSPLVHPQGLKDVSKALHDAGMKFLLWFEPERVIRTTPTAVAHPEYFLSNDNPNDDNRLLNLGDEEAWEYCFETLSKLIEELNIDCYRQDFNFSPLNYWRKNDDPDRKGITEIKHINGMYRLWDELLKKFPHLIIDDCASGGRRIDIETLRRSIPLWRSDLYCPANYDIEGSQCHNQSFNLWMPYSGAGSGRSYDEYRIRSAYAAALTCQYPWTEKEPFCDTEEKVDFIKRYTEEYLKVRPYFSEDFYPLTELSEKLDVWCAMQFNRPDKNDGIIEVFRRENSPYETACFMLRGLDESADYLFIDADGGEFTLSGKELMKNGLNITVSDKRKAKIYFYNTI